MVNVYSLNIEQDRFLPTLKKKKLTSAEQMQRERTDLFYSIQHREWPICIATACLKSSGLTMAQHLQFFWKSFFLRRHWVVSMCEGSASEHSGVTCLVWGCFIRSQIGGISLAFLPGGSMGLVSILLTILMLSDSPQHSKISWPSWTNLDQSKWKIRAYV